MSLSILEGTRLTDYYIVQEDKDGVVPPELADYVDSARTVLLDSKYENSAYLLVYSLKRSLPSSDQWPYILPYGHSSVVVQNSWSLSSIKGQSNAFAIRARTPPRGTLVSIVQMMAVKKETFIVASVAWHGFPFFNRFFIGTKPGMAERTEALLLAAFDFQE